MDPKTAAVIITRTEDGFTVLDPNGVVHEADDEAMLGIVCSQIVNDPDLPRYETQTAQAAQVENLATKAASALLPDQFEFVAVPAVEALRKGLNKLKGRQLGVERPTKIVSTPESAERARARRADINRRKEVARKEAEKRRKNKPRLSWRGS
jgi:hypothetical protein